MDSEALHIHELVVEAGALLEWVAAGTLPGEAVWIILDRLRAQLQAMAEHTGDPEARDAACAMVCEIDALLQVTPAPPQSELGAA